MVSFYLINSVKPKDFRESVIDELRIAYLGDNELFEALLQEWMKQHLNYLRWYAQASSDPLFPLDLIYLLLKPPVVCYSWHLLKASHDRNLYVRYGLLFQAWERYREDPPIPLPVGIVSLSSSSSGASASAGSSESSTASLKCLLVLVPSLLLPSIRYQTLTRLPAQAHVTVFVQVQFKFRNQW